MTALTAPPCYRDHLQSSVGSLASQQADATPRSEQHKPSGCFPLNDAIASSSSTADHLVPQDLVCPYADCGKVFIKRSKFEDHKRSHTGERPFSCDAPECGKSFTRKDHLQRHARSHQSTSTSTVLGEDSAQQRPFLCTVVQSKERMPCGRRFLTQQHLTRHVREFHELSETAEEDEATNTDAEDKGKKRKRSRKGGEGAYLVSGLDRNIVPGKGANCPTTV